MSTELAVESANGETTVYRATTEDSTKKKRDNWAQLGQVIDT